ncbi:MAG: hypothetical protein JSS78_05565 [Bacteroidetes bacterium]|nr:hypothetical protein [Bacteroidota bacterium]
MELGILVFICIRNYFRARVMQLNAGLWAFYTFIAALATWFVGGIIITLIMIGRDAQLRALLMHQPVDRQQAVDYLMRKNLFVPQVFLIVCMIGGYLIVRHFMSKQSITNNNNNQI